MIHHEARNNNNSQPTMLSNNNPSSTVPSSDRFEFLENGGNNKRKRRPAGTPDPDAEVVSLSPRTLLESDRYVCEICNQGFQRDQNLQMHRRRHKVPWKLLKRETPVTRKRVFVCPEPSCLHHDPCHALGDLVGIKKHFRRKHSNHKQWICEKCSKGYAVQSDYKAHLKTCGTRGHSCDCGRVFSRVESFIEHQDACHMGRLRSESHSLQPGCLSRTASSPSPSSDNNFSSVPWTGLTFPKPAEKLLMNPDRDRFNPSNALRYQNLELQLLTRSTTLCIPETPKADGNQYCTQLQLSIGSSEIRERNEYDAANANLNKCSGRSSPVERNETTVSKLKEQAREQRRLATAEKAYAEEARRQAKRQVELAEQEFANAKRLRQQAQAELDNAHAMRDHATKQIGSTIFQITCRACKQQFKARSTATAVVPDENSLVLSYMSSAITETEVQRNDRTNHARFGQP